MFRAAALALLLLRLALPAGAVELGLGPGGEASYAVPLRSLQQLRFLSTVRQRYDFSCGSAAVATLLSYHYEQPVDEATVLEGMFRRGDQEKIRREGFSMLDMKRYLDTLGLAADGYRVGLAQVEQAGVPAIALLTGDGYRHFVVVKGISADRVLVGDPSRGTRSIPRARFEAAQSGIFLLVRNRAEIGRRHFNDGQEWRSGARALYDPQFLRAALDARAAVPGR